MKVQAWVSLDGETVEIREHEGHAGLSAWWDTLPGIVGVIVHFPDGTTHRMEASEAYAVLPRGRERERFWNGDGSPPAGARVVPGIEVPDALYLAVDAEMDRG